MTVEFSALSAMPHVCELTYVLVELTKNRIGLFFGCIVFCLPPQSK